MGATFVVTLREAFEAALILGIVYTYLAKIGGRRYYYYATVGAALGGVASVALGVGVTVFSGPLLDLGPDVLGAAVIFLAAALLTWHGWWMRRHATAIKGDLQRRIDEAQAGRRLWIIGLIAFTGVFREGAETVLFLWGLVAQTASGWSAIVGGVLGVAAAAGLGYAIFRGGARLSVTRFFALTSVLLLFISAGLVSAGVGKLQGLGVLPAADALWDTSALLSDESLPGTLLRGLLGYRARPSTLEVAAYGLYVVAAGVALFGRVGRPRRPLPPSTTQRGEKNYLAQPIRNG